MTSDRIILGIDPGTVIMGYGFIHQKGNKIELITMGVLKLSKVEGHHNKLKRIFEGTNSLIEQYKPDELAIEAPFYGKDVQAMLKLGRAQGVAIAAALSKSIPIFEYAPRKIKKAVTGNGNASKEQVAAMLESLVVFREYHFHRPPDNLCKNMELNSGVRISFFCLSNNLPPSTIFHFCDFCKKQHPLFALQPSQYI